MAVFFLFLRNVLLPIEILKIKILEHSDPPSQHFFAHKAFSHSFLCRRKVMLCHLAEWHRKSTFLEQDIYERVDSILCVNKSPKSVIFWFLEFVP